MHLFLIFKPPPAHTFYNFSYAVARSHITIVFHLALILQH